MKNWNWLEQVDILHRGSIVSAMRIVDIYVSFNRDPR